MQYVPPMIHENRMTGKIWDLCATLDFARLSPHTKTSKAKGILCVFFDHASRDSRVASDLRYYDAKVTVIMILCIWIYHHGPLLLTWFNFNPQIGIINNIHYQTWDEITCPFPNFNGCTVEVWEWISYFILHVTGMWLLIHAGIQVKPC